MKVNGIQCNLCSDTVYLDSNFIGNLPKGWYALTDSSSVVGRELHFCCINHLKKWAQGHETTNDATPRAVSATIGGRIEHE
jgi:hypothetical protein